MEEGIESGRVKKIKLAYIFVAIAVSFLMLGTSLATILQGTSTPSIPTRIQPGSLTSGTDYLIFTDGSDYFAKNGQTGGLDYSSSNASAVIQYALDHKPTVTLSSGVFIIPYTLFVNDGNALRGAGLGTILRLINGSNCEVIENGYVPLAYDTNIYIGNMKLIADGATHTPGVFPMGIWLRNVWNALVENVYITCDSGTSMVVGIEIYSGCENVTIQNCRVDSVSNNAFEATASTHIKFINNIAYWAADAGIMLLGCAYSSILNNDIIASSSSSRGGIEFATGTGPASGYDGLISGNVVHGGYYGIFLGQQGAGTVPQRVQITSNVITGPKVGIELAGPTYVGVSDNDIQGAGTGIHLLRSAYDHSPCFFITISNNIIHHTTGVASTVSAPGQGIIAYNAPQEILIQSNSFYDIYQNGIYSDSTGYINCSISENHFEGCSQQTTNTYDSIHLTLIQGGLITDNFFYQGGGALAGHPKYGLEITNALSDALISNNYLKDAGATAPVSLVSDANLVVTHNIGTGT